MKFRHAGLAVMDSFGQKCLLDKMTVLRCILIFSQRHNVITS